MRRMFIIGATVLALSVTAVVAWAGTGPSASVPGQVAGVLQDQEIDPVVSRFMERVHNVWTWPGDAIEYLRRTNLDNAADWGRDIDYDWDMEHTHNVADDRNMDQTYDQDLDRRYDHDMDRDMDHTQDITRDRDMNQGYDQNYDYDRDLDRTRDRDMNQNYDWNTGGSRSMGIDRDCDRRGGWSH